jgi:RHS repeat-associated protein
MATNFFWDDLEDNIIEEYNDAGVTIAEYTTEPDHFGNVISQRRGSQSSFFHYDALGSTLAVTDESQNVTDTRAYSAFGETTESTGSTIFPYQYVGQKGYYFDVDGSRYVVRQRSYGERLARWLSMDPIAIGPNDASLYMYANNSPLTTVDPSGLTPFPAISLPNPCGTISVEAHPPHSIVIYWDGVCPADTEEARRLFRVGITLKINARINKSEPIKIECPDPLVCVQTISHTEVPIAIPFIWSEVIYWKQGILRPIEVEKDAPGAKGPCTILIIGALQLLMDIEVGCCKQP